jgi:hypothetical protein
MLIAEDEALACLKVLVALAKADGKVKADEKKSLAAAISRLELPLGITVDSLLAETVDVARELANSSIAAPISWRMPTEPRRPKSRRSSIRSTR